MRSGDEDPLLKKVRQAEERAKSASKKASGASAGLGVGGKVGEAIRWLESIGKVYTIVKSLLRTLRKYTGPLGSLIAWIARKIGAGLKWGSFEREIVKQDEQGGPNFSFFGKVFKFFAGKARAKTLKYNIFYKSDLKYDEEGDRVFSKRRLAKTLAGVAVAMLSAHIALSALYFYATKFEEVIYTSGGKQQIEKGDLYEFTGCTSLPCSTKLRNGKFYDIESSWYFPSLIYPEEDVYAAIPEQDGACHIKGYGLYFKNLKFLHRTFQWYQKIYDVTCRPLTEEEKKKVIDTGTIPQLPGTAPTKR